MAMRLVVGSTYRDRQGFRWRIVLVDVTVGSKSTGFAYLAQLEANHRVRQWLTEDGRWSLRQDTEVDLVERVA